MMERDVLITTRYGRQPVFMAATDKTGRYPPVIIYRTASHRHPAASIPQFGGFVGAARCAVSF
jgi:hypothetical protein